MQLEDRPIHSIITHSQWQPPKHSTMLDQPKEMTSIGSQHQSACTGQLSLPSLSADSGMASSDGLHHSQALVTGTISTTIATKNHNQDATPTIPLSNNHVPKDDKNGEAVHGTCAVSDTRKANSHQAVFSTSVPSTSSRPVDSGLSISTVLPDDSRDASTPGPDSGTKTAPNIWSLNTGHPQVPTWTNTTPSKWLGLGAGGSCSTLQQMLSGKKNPAFATSTLLPSRLRVTTHGSNSGCNGSPSTSPCRLGGRENVTPSGRNVGNRPGFTTSGSTSIGQLSQELLKKKCFLKSRLKFSEEIECK